MSKVTGDTVSVEIIPNEQGLPQGSLPNMEVIVEGEVGPFSELNWAELNGLRCMGTSRSRAIRDVPRPAVLLNGERRSLALLLPTKGP